MSAQPEAIERWAVIRRVGIGQLVATLRLPPFKAGDVVTADLSWQGQQPSEVADAPRNALGRQVKEMAEQLGVRIRLPLPQQPHQPGAAAPNLAPGTPAMVTDPQACPVSSPLVTT